MNMALPADVVEIERIESVGIMSFASSIGEKIVVIERGPMSLEFCEKMWGKGYLFLAHFKDCDTIEGIMLCGRSGNGGTPEEAISSYCRKIQGHRLVFHAFDKKNRKEIMAPEKLHLEPANA